MSVSGATLELRRKQNLCVSCGRRPAPDRPWICQPCQRDQALAKKRQRQRAK